MKVKVGAGGGAYSGELPEIEVSEPTLEGDPVSGSGGDRRRSSTRPAKTSDRLLLYAVARKGDEVVAAGRGAIEHLKADDQKAPLQHLLHRRSRAAPS